jgi:hypothetical protein
MKEHVTNCRYYSKGSLISKDMEKLPLRDIQASESWYEHRLCGNTAKSEYQVDVTFQCISSNTFFIQEFCTGRDSCVPFLYTIEAFNEDNSEKAVIKDVSLSSPSRGIGSSIQYIK